MSEKLSKEEQDRYARLANWAESDAVSEGMGDAVITAGEGNEPGRSLLVAALGSDAEVDAVLGRPSIDQGRPAGVSPVRHVRLSPEMDTALKARATAEHRKPSEVVREALAAYLKVS